MFRILPTTARLSRCRICSLTPKLTLMRISPLFQQHELQKRTYIDIHPVLLPPVVFSGLLVTLWTWKCLMMIIFQNKIIYMPGLPPNARHETIADYKAQCQGIQWREEKIRSLDRTRISLCIASNDIGLDPMRRVYILYFQGNASSLPPRLPFLSPVLRMLGDGNEMKDPVKYTMVCCSYRGYWTSKGRPSEKGIAMDAIAALEWIRRDSANSTQSFNSEDKTPVVIWGQSIGAGVATSLATEQHLFSKSLILKTLILETPFRSIRSMLETLYPQKWLPYRYLWPFLRNHLDSWTGLGLVRKRFNIAGVKTPKVLILKAGRDELVPSSHGEELENRCIDLGFDVEKRSISGALHTEVMVRSEGRKAVVEAIRKAGNED